MTLVFEGKTSVNGRTWVVKNPSNEVVSSVMRKYEISDAMARIVVNRGYDQHTAGDFLNATIKNFLPDPSIFLDMDIAIERTYNAILDKQPIVVYGDYDVDGATASAVLRRYFNSIGYPIKLYIPDRIEEGYGANAEALTSLYQQGAKLVLMVDCGTNAFDPLACAKNMGLDVVVLDHHTAEKELPSAFAIVNPNRLDQELGDRQDLKLACAAGMAFLFIVGLNRYLRQKGYFKTQTEPDLRQFLDLVALGTVCDVMPLTGLNRAFVAQGLRIMNKQQNLGLTKLFDVAALESAARCYHLGFVLGPRINAGGRVGRSDLGSRLLTTQDESEAKKIAQELNELNKQRQEIEKQVLDQAVCFVEKHQLHKNPLIMVAEDNWHPGVIGIVASRLKELYNRPSCVVGFEGDEGKGSGRSVPGIQLGEAMHAAVHEGLLEKGGGHAMAAGFTVLRSNYERFYSFLNERFLNSDQELPTLSLDGCVSGSAINIQLAKSFEMLEPFGQGNPTPRFVILHMRLKYCQKVGENHLRCTFEDETGTPLKVMAFRAVGTAIEQALSTYAKQNFHIAGTIKHDVWQGRESVTVMLDDLMVG